MADSLGSLVDKLTVVNLKIWHGVDIVKTGTDDATVASAAKKVQALNDYRNEIIKEINSVWDSILDGTFKKTSSSQQHEKFYSKGGFVK